MSALLALLTLGFVFGVSVDGMNLQSRKGLEEIE